MGEPRIPFRGRAIKPMLRKAYDDESLPPDQRKGGAGEKYAEIPIGIWDLVHLGSPCDRESGARFNVNLGFRCPSPPRIPGLPPFSREVNFRVRDSEGPVHTQNGHSGLIRRNLWAAYAIEGLVPGLISTTPSDAPPRRKVRDFQVLTQPYPPVPYTPRG